MSRIRIAIVEDDLDWLKAMVSFLNRQEDMVIVGTASTREAAINLAKSIETDVILMDINLTKNNRDGIYTAMKILEFTQTKIIMVTCLTDEDTITRAFTAGAVSYVSKENYLEIPDVIHAAYQKKAPIEALLKEFLRLKEEEQLKELSDSEKEIYRLLEEGHTQSQVEKLLFKSKSTIKTQVRSILKKLGASNIKEAISKVKSKGISEQG